MLDSNTEVAMSKKLLHATGFGRLHQLITENRPDEARELLKALQDEYLSLLEENEALKRQLIEVAQVLDMAECMEFDGQKYWLTDELRHKGPYCQLCYDRDGLLMRLQKQQRYWKCHCCGNVFLDAKAMQDQSSKRTFPVGLPKAPIPLFVK
jgi:hypothetical protein